MKNYLIKALINFNDMEEKTEAGTDTPRKKDDVWKATKERYEYLASKNAVMLVGIDKIEEPKEIEATIKEVEAPKEVKEIKKPRKTTIKNKKLTSKK